LLLVGLFLPAISSGAVSNRPLEIYMWGIPLKILTSFLGWVMVQHTASAYEQSSENSNPPGMPFFASIVIIMVLHEVAGNLIFISSMSFFAKISDPSIGGTYMTLLNTISNLGSKWPNSTALWLLPKLTLSVCENAISRASASADFNFLDYYCNTEQSKKQCVAAGGVCNMKLDGYTVQIVGAAVIGLIWIAVMRERVLHLQSLPLSEWLVSKESSKSI